MPIKMAFAVYCAGCQSRSPAMLLLVEGAPGVATVREPPLVYALQVPFVTRIAIPPKGFREGSVTGSPFSSLSCTADVPFELTWLTTDCTCGQGTLRRCGPWMTAASGVRSTPRVRRTNANTTLPQLRTSHGRGDPGLTVCKTLGSERQPAQCAQETPFPREGDWTNLDCGFSRTVLDGHRNLVP